MSDAEAPGAFDAPHLRDDHSSVADLDRLEVVVEHSPEQTVVKAELPNGSVAAAVDLGDLGLASTMRLARDLRDALDRATTPASGGDA